MSNPIYIASPSSHQPYVPQKYSYSNIYQSNQYANPYSNYQHTRNYRPPSATYVQIPVYPQYLPPNHLHYQPQIHQQQRNSVAYPNQQQKNHILSDVEINYLGEKLAAIIEENNIVGPDSPPSKPTHFEIEEIPSVLGSKISQEQLFAPPTFTPLQHNSSQNLTTSSTPYPAHPPPVKRTAAAYYKNLPGAGVSFPARVGRNPRHQGHLRTGSEDVRVHVNNNIDSNNGSQISTIFIPSNPIHNRGHKRNASDGNPTRRSRFPFRRSNNGSRHSRNPSNGGSNLIPNIEEPEPQRECTVCLTDYPVIDFYTLSCGHSFCMTCTNQHMSVLISSGITRILCPQSGCGKEISVEDLACVVDSSLIDKLLKFEKKKMVARSKNARFCPAIDCGLPVLGDGENNKLTCECGKQFCFDCNLDWHESMTCKQARKKLNNKKESQPSEKQVDKWKKKHTKPCPRCSIPIQKTAGCEFIQCSGCDYQFCWKCLEPHDHFVTTHKHGRRGRKKRIAKKVAVGGAIGVAVAVVAVPALLIGGLAIPALIIGGAVVASRKKD